MDSVTINFTSTDSSGFVQGKNLNGGWPNTFRNEPQNDLAFQSEIVFLNTSVALSAREGEVLGWSARGKTKSEIATILALSEHTVHSHVRRALKKLDAVNLTQGACLAFKLGLICI